MAGVLRALPNDADVRLHAAFIYAASGARAVAENQLREALKLNPALEKSDEVKALRAQLENLAAASK
jgi:hypothetical protein